MWNTVMPSGFGLTEVDQRPLQGTHLVVMLGVKRGYGIPGIMFRNCLNLHHDRDGDNFDGLV